MIRAIFFDIDGTLLDSATGKVPPSTLACLRALQRKGVRLWVATGRFPAMTTFLRDIFPFDGVITLNGQLATDKDGQVLHRMAHEPENIRALVELVRQDPEPFPCLIIEEEQCFSLRESPVIQEHFAWAGLPAPEAYHLSRLEEHPVLQFLAYITPQEYGRLAPLRHIEITGSGHSIADIIPLGGGKEVGIAAVAQRFGWKREEIMVFGDGPNDAKMLAWAGTGVGPWATAWRRPRPPRTTSPPPWGRTAYKTRCSTLGCWKKPSYKKSGLGNQSVFLFSSGRPRPTADSFLCPPQTGGRTGPAPPAPDGGPPLSCTNFPW